VTTHDTRRTAQDRAEDHAELARVRARLLVDPRLDAVERAALARTSLELSAHDDMYVHPHADHYLQVGLSALRCVEAALVRRTAPRPIERVLDFPCGHGRVMRHLAARWPGVRLVGVEIVGTGRAFCAAAFGAETFASRPGFVGVDPGRDFDLAWCGSLATHVDAAALAALLDVLCGALAPGGVAVVTTHGARVAERLEAGVESYGLCPADRAAVLAAYRTEGFGYADYQGTSGTLDGGGYGTSLVAPQHFVERALAGRPWRLLGHAERAWDDHQDVFAFERFPTP
jgi:SAM-dependent methyltransferase